MSTGWMRVARGVVQIAAFVACICGALDAYAARQPMANPERRMALVIGNAAYRTSPLKNPVNDADAMAKALGDLGFEVTVLQDASLDRMLDAMRTFVRRSQKADVRLFYYAGHGMQVKGRNFLVPVDAVIGGEDEVPSTTADLNELVNQLGAIRTGLNIIILDACRNNPFAGNAMVGPDGRVVRFRGSVSPGLAAVDAPQGTLVAFATAPGAVAMDGGSQQNSLYTRHLLENIRIPALPVEQLFKLVRIGVARDTQRMQIPWESSSLMGDFCFREVPGKGCVVDAAASIGPIKIAPR